MAAGEGGEKAKPGKPRTRALSEAEQKLWGAVVKDATPLARRKPAEAAPMPAAPEAPSIVTDTKKTPVFRIHTETTKPAPAGPPPLTGLDRRTSQRLARGQIEAEATFDLHGHAREEARGLLLGFLGRSRARGLRCVIVITGKGENPFTRHTLHSARFHEAPEHTGVLRSALPSWLGEPEFRALVAGFQPAHPRHGGGGAFYIWLRKKR
jgi:DNA-nicking Smr family endonuclease